MPNSWIESQLSEYFALSELRKNSPDPFEILNITSTESPYTHFLGWVLNPQAAHPWKEEFLTALLAAAGQPAPPRGESAIEFFIERYAFSKDPGDEFGFTHPDIVALCPNADSPRWCLVLENKFDSKEGRAAGKATQCAKYEERARNRFGQIEYALLFTTRTGEKALGESTFAPLNYATIANVFREVRTRLAAEGKWPVGQANANDSYACFLLDAFLSHLTLKCPAKEVRAALKSLARNEYSVPVSSQWLQQHPQAIEKAAGLNAALERWDLASMIESISADGASPEEIDALRTLFAWGESHGWCEFGNPQTPSVTIKVNSQGGDVQLLCIQARRLRFYWVHLVGSKESGNVARPDAGAKFPGAFELAAWFCEMLNKTFDWELEFKRADADRFREPSRPLADIAEPKRLQAFIELLNQVAARVPT